MPVSRQPPRTQNIQTQTQMAKSQILSIAFPIAFHYRKKRMCKILGKKTTIKLYHVMPHAKFTFGAIAKIKIQTKKSQ